MSPYDEIRIMLGQRGYFSADTLAQAMTLADAEGPAYVKNLIADSFDPAKAIDDAMRDLYGF